MAGFFKYLSEQESINLNEEVNDKTIADVLVRLFVGDSKAAKKQLNSMETGLKVNTSDMSSYNKDFAKYKKEFETIIRKMKNDFEY